MHRPERIGPYPLFDVGTANIVQAPNWVAKAQGLVTPNVHTPIATAGQQDIELQYACTPSAMTQGAWNGIGVGLVTDFPSDVVLVTLAASIIVEDIECEIFPFIGRAINSTLNGSATIATNPMERYCPLSFDQFTDGNATICTVRETIMVRQQAAFAGGGLLLGGFQFRNSSATANGTFKTHMWMSKYLSDTQTFDPPRN